MKNVISMSMLTYVILFSTKACSASNDTLSAPRDIIFLEFAGLNGSIWSLNYERTFWHYNEHLKLSCRSGFGRIPGFRTVTNNWIKGIWTIPVIVSVFIGKKYHYGILGCSYTASFGGNQIDSSSTPPVYYKSFESAFFFRMGYRYVSKKGALIEVYPNWLLTNSPSNYFYVGCGVSFGLAFPFRIWD